MAITLNFPGGSGGGSWGAITGTLSAQTDLQSALDAKLPLTGGTLTGPLIMDVNGAASTPPLLMNGDWFSGGSSTTTKPQLLIEPSGVTSNAWSTNGTGIGINAASGFAGNLIDAQINGASKFSVDASGRVTANGGDYNVPWIQTKGGAIGLGAGNSTIMQLITNNGERVAISQNYLEMAQTLYLGWRAGGTVGNGGLADLKLSRVDAAILGLQADTGGATLELLEMTAPAAPGSNKARLYIEDNGSGKTRLMALFPSGAAQQIAIEP